MNFGPEIAGHSTDDGIDSRALRREASRVAQSDIEEFEAVKERAVPV
jgi:hypothetical protein